MNKNKTTTKANLKREDHPKKHFTNGQYTDCTEKKCISKNVTSMLKNKQNTQNEVCFAALKDVMRQCLRTSFGSN